MSLGRALSSLGQSLDPAEISKTVNMFAKLESGAVKSRQSSEKHSLDLVKKAVDIQESALDVQAKQQEKVDREREQNRLKTNEGKRVATFENLKKTYGHLPAFSNFSKSYPELNKYGNLEAIGEFESDLLAYTDSLTHLNQTRSALDVGGLPMSEQQYGELVGLLDKRDWEEYNKALDPFVKRTDVIGQQTAKNEIAEAQITALKNKHSLSMYDESLIPEAEELTRQLTLAGSAEERRKLIADNQKAFYSGYFDEHTRQRELARNHEEEKRRSGNAEKKIEIDWVESLRESTRELSSLDTSNLKPEDLTDNSALNKLDDIEVGLRELHDASMANGTFPSHSPSHIGMFDNLMSQVKAAKAKVSAKIDEGRGQGAQYDSIIFEGVNEKEISEESTVDEVVAYARKSGVPNDEVDKFKHYYEKRQGSIFAEHEKALAVSNRNSRLIGELKKKMAPDDAEHIVDSGVDNSIGILKSFPGFQHLETLMADTKGGTNMSSYQPGVGHLFSFPQNLVAKAPQLNGKKVLALQSKPVEGKVVVHGFTKDDNGVLYTFSAPIGENPSTGLPSIDFEKASTPKMFSPRSTSLSGVPAIGLPAGTTTPYKNIVQNFRGQDYSRYPQESTLTDLTNTINFLTKQALSDNAKPYIHHLLQVEKGEVSPRITLTKGDKRIVSYVKALLKAKADIEDERSFSDMLLDYNPFAEMAGWREEDHEISQWERMVHAQGLITEATLSGMLLSLE